MSTEGLYERVLAGLGAGVEIPAPRPPRASAAVVLWRRSATRRLEVFWVRRSPRLRFMGGWHAFPGGAVSRRDAGVDIVGRPRGVERAPTDGDHPAAVTEGIELGPLLPDGLLVGAVRELFEETGLLLARSQEGAPAVDDDRLDASRNLLLAGKADFGALVADLGLMLDCRALTYAGRWLTPPLGAVRFDNRFFLLEWPESQSRQPQVWPGELDSGEWLAPEEARRRWRREGVITAPPILHILRVLAEDGPEDGLARLWSPRETNLGDFRCIEFRPGVLLFPLRTPTLPPATHTNVYVLGLEEAVVVDPGSPLDGEIDRLAMALREMPARMGRRVSAIWLTHHHPDHVGGVERLRRALKVPVLAHPLTAERLGRVGIKIDGELLEEDEPRLLAATEPYALRVLHTPGHARGHLCFLDEQRRTLVAGDMVAGFGTIVIDPPEGDMDDYLESLGRLSRLAGGAPLTLFPSHGPTIYDGAAKLDEYIAHRREREAAVLATWNDGLRDLSAMIGPVYGDLDRLAHPLAERQILAHLERLAHRGKIDLEPGDLIR